MAAAMATVMAAPTAATSAKEYGYVTRVMELKDDRLVRRRRFLRLSIRTCLSIRTSARSTAYTSDQIVNKNKNKNTRFSARSKNYIRIRARSVYGSWIEAYHTILNIRREWRW